MKVNIKKWTSMLMLVFIIGAVAGCGSKEDKKAESDTVMEEHGHEEETPTIATLTEEQIKTVGIEFGSVENKSLAATIRANGFLEVPNNRKANITALYGGVVKTMSVIIGDHVKKGQVIATIVNPQFVQLQEEYISLGSKIIFAEQELQRQRELNAGNAGALKNLQSVTSEINSLRTRKASLQQQIQLMGIDPDKINSSNMRSVLSITSPVSGTVTNVYAKLGSYVDVSSPVAEIIDNNSLHLDLRVYEKDLPLLKVGQTIHFTLTNNAVKEYDAKIFNIGAAFDNDSKTVPVHCDIQGDKKGLIDGMNITAMISLNEVTQQAVPNDAIVEADSKYYIFIVTDKKPEEHHEEEADGHNDEKKDGKHTEEEKGSLNFEKIEVVKGTSNMGYTAVTFVNEIPANAKVVTKGAFFINAKLTNSGEHEH